MKKLFLILLAVFVVAALALSLTAASVWARNGGGEKPPQPTPPAQIGALVAQLTPKLAEKLGIEYREGVVVIKVLPGSPAEKAGLLAKDIITAVNGAAVKAPGELKKAVLDSPGGVALTVVRQATETTISVVPEEGFPPPGQPHRPAFPRLSHPYPLGWLYGLEELKDIPPAERFSHFLGGESRITDKEGKPHTVKLIPGEVKEVTAETITIITNEGIEATFPLDQATQRPGLVQRLKPGTKVVVTTVDDGAARVVVPVPALKGQPRPGRPGWMGRAGGYGFPRFSR